MVNADGAAFARQACDPVNPCLAVAFPGRIVKLDAVMSFHLSVGVVFSWPLNSVVRNAGPSFASPAAPEAGTEVECPKCGTVFAAPEPQSAAGKDTPKKKPKADGDEKDRRQGQRPGRKEIQEGQERRKGERPQRPAEAEIQKRKRTNSRSSPCW